VSDKVPHKTTGKITVLYVSIFTFWKFKIIYVQSLGSGCRSRTEEEFE
jgi:hypothetical protein